MLTYSKKVLLLLVFVIFFGTVPTEVTKGKETAYISNTIHSNVHTGSLSADGSAGERGTDGSHGLSGKNGADGIAGSDGVDGVLKNADSNAAIQSITVLNGVAIETSTTTDRHSADAHVIHAMSADTTEEKRVLLQRLLVTLQQLLSQYVF